MSLELVTTVSDQIAFIVTSKSQQISLSSVLSINVESIPVPHIFWDFMVTNII